MTRTEVKPQSCPKCRSKYWEKELTPYWKMIREKNKGNKNGQKEEDTYQKG